VIYGRWNVVSVTIFTYNGNGMVGWRNTSAGEGAMKDLMRK